MQNQISLGMVQSQPICQASGHQEQVQLLLQWVPKASKGLVLVKKEQEGIAELARPVSDRVGMNVQTS